MSLKRATALIVLLSLAVTSVGSVVASTAFDVIPASQKMLVNSDNLDEILFAGNPDLLHQMNNVMKARDQINIARGELLPSLSIGMLVTLSNPVTFLMNSVSCLVPFLFPAKWFDLKTTKRTYNAEIMGFHTTKLNLYATVYTLISRVQGDEAGLALMEGQYKRFDDYLEDMKTRAAAGFISQMDVVRAEIDGSQRLADLSKMRQLIAEERATLRKIFGLDLNVELELALAPLEQTSLEGSKPADVLDKVVAAAPEKMQLDLLASAAKASVRSVQWAFLSGCSGNQGAVSTNSGSAFSFSTGTSVNLGFGYFPRIKLARRNAKEVEYRSHDLVYELSRLLENTISEAAETKLRLNEANSRVVKAEVVLADVIRRYATGQAPVREVLDGYALVERARMDSHTASTELTGHRVTLRRLAMDDQFKQIFADSQELLPWQVKKRKRL